MCLIYYLTDITEKNHLPKHLFYPYLKTISFIHQMSTYIHTYLQENGEGNPESTIYMQSLSAASGKYHDKYMILHKYIDSLPHS